MGRPDNKNLSEMVDVVKSWIPRRSEPANMSRDFWMPDKSCRVCYECDSQFTIINRRHHCRLCGRVFCARCTANSVPALSDESNSGREDGERIRVCNYCFKQWKQGSATGDDTITLSSPGLSSSPSSSSLVSNHSGCYTCNSGSSVDLAGCSTGPFQHVSCAVGQISPQIPQMGSKSTPQDQATSHGKLDYLDARDTFSDQFGSFSRSDEEDDDYPYYRSHSDASLFSPTDPSYGTINYLHTDDYDTHLLQPNEENMSPTSDATILPDAREEKRPDIAAKLEKESNVRNDGSVVDVEAVDYENNGLFWLPPEADDEEDEQETTLSDEDDDTGEDAAEKWGYLRSSSFGVGESRNRDRSNEEHRKVMKRVVDGHFKSLISQLLSAENLPVEDNMDESWLDMITTLSWEAATLLKPDTSMSGGMDPGGYVKVKCLAFGHRSESMVVKGIACKKNVSHRRMTSKIDKARLLLLGGALEYQRVANHLSSFDTLLQQEMDHLKMAVAKIDAHRPSVLLVEKSVSRYAQDYLLAKDISLVLNVKRPLLERVARCTGAQIVPSVDNLSATKLGYCDSFHVEKFLENIGAGGPCAKKVTKTLMFFEGCPRPLGCTILLKGGSIDELKKVKHVVHYGVFAAYHLALETSFLADEGASLPELPLTSPIRVALPDRPSSVDRSITMIPGYNSPNGSESTRIAIKPETECCVAPNSGAQYQIPHHSIEMYGSEDLDSQWKKLSAVKQIDSPSPNGRGIAKTLEFPNEVGNDYLDSNNFVNPKVSPQGFSYYDGDELPSNSDNSELVPMEQPFKEEPPTPSDQQSILVSLSTRCAWRGRVCDRAHLLRIKYYGNLDKPLGRFLRDQLLDEGYRCQSCEMPSEAHIHCYTHQQGSLTISVKKLPESLLSGERQGKIWMWHRCLRCPRTNGFPPATKRVVMSDAAWGLSCGKFLELSFSNHAAASRVASCGHSLHRDCLRFYGYGRMIACFRYAPISVHSVYLPPPKVEFNYYMQEWIQNEFDEVRSKADFFFTEVLEAICKILGTIASEINNSPDLAQWVGEMELMLQMEKDEFQESLQCVLHKEVKSDKPVIDILDINSIRRKLVYHAYVWDQRLAQITKSSLPYLSNSMLKERPVRYREKRSEINSIPRSGRSFSSWDCARMNVNNVPLPEVGQGNINHPNGFHEEKLGTRRSLSNKEDDYSSNNSCGVNMEQGRTVRRARSEGHFSMMESLTNNSDAALTGNYQPTMADCEEKGNLSDDALPREFSAGMISTTELVTGDCPKHIFVAEEIPPSSPDYPQMDLSDLENTSSWLRIPFSVLFRSLNKSSATVPQKLGKIYDYNPVYLSSLRELVKQGGARLLLPTSSSFTILPIYDDEPTSIISYALISPDYQNLMSGEFEKQKESLEPSMSFSFLESVNLLSLHSFDEAPYEAFSSHSSVDESFLSSGSRSFTGLEPLFSNSLHARVSFSDDGPPVKVKYTVTCYFAKQFEALRRICCASELDFIRSLSRCKKWGAQGGKSNVFFAKTLDDRFIIKQVTKTELESFIKFAPSYFKYLSEAVLTGCPSCLAKILGIYQVTTKHVKGGKESRMDVLVMENLLFKRNITRLYDLKGSARSRYNADSSGSNKVLLDQNLIEAMPTSPIFLGTKAKRLLERAVWNDTAFLAAIDVMDYSLLVGVDEEKQELVLGIIDFMRQYTWDKHLETWVKASGILGGPKNASPTVISPLQYKKRFRKAMSAYFLMVPDQWSSSVPSQPDTFCE